MPVAAFMRRFYRHIVPHRFVRIRSFGLLAHRNRRLAIHDCREFFAVKRPPESLDYGRAALFRRVTGTDPHHCPACLKGRLVESFTPQANGLRAPPPTVTERCSA
jgi:hypothetical protein